MQCRLVRFLFLCAIVSVLPVNSSYHHQIYLLKGLTTKYIWCYYADRTHNIFGVTQKREDGVNEALRAARAAFDKTQAQVAKSAGISETQYQNIEYDKSEPGVQTAIRIADTLGVIDLREIFKAPGDNQAENQASKG